jgi:hypothetical protein
MATYLLKDSNASPDIVINLTHLSCLELSFLVRVLTPCVGHSIEKRVFVKYGGRTVAYAATESVVVSSIPSTN